MNRQSLSWRADKDSRILDNSQRRDLPRGKDFGWPFLVITAVSERRLIPFTKHYLLMDMFDRKGRAAPTNAAALQAGLLDTGAGIH